MTIDMNNSDLQRALAELLEIPGGKEVAKEAIWNELKIDEFMVKICVKSFFWTPKKFEKFIQLMSLNDPNTISWLIRSFSSICRRYTNNSKELLNELSSMSSSFKLVDFGDFRAMDGYNEVTYEEEFAFADRGKTFGEKKKRMKLLAALDVARRSDELIQFASSDLGRLVSSQMYAIMRSIAQFMFYEYYADGINMQINRERGAKKPTDRTGIILLVDEAEKNNNIAFDKVSFAWQFIKRYLSVGGIKTYDNDYSVEFKPDEKEDKVYSGHILQIDPDGKEYEMSYEAFKAFFRQLKKKGES